MTSASNHPRSRTRNPASRHRGSQYSIAATVCRRSPSQPPVISIMQQDDIASAHAPQALDHRSHRLRFPIPGPPRPHHHARKSQSARHAIQIQPAKSIGRTHPQNFFAHCGRNCFVAARQFFSDVRCRQKTQPRMRFGVIRDRVPARDDFHRDSGNARTCLPTTKNVARTEFFSSTSSSAGVTAGFGPSSKVSAIAPGSCVLPDRAPENLRRRRHRSPRRQRRHAESCSSPNRSALPRFHALDSRTRPAAKCRGSF